MKFFTFDKERNIGLPIYFEKDEKFICEDSSIFKFILVSSGTAIIELNKRKIVVMAPAVFCLNDEDVLNIIEHHDLKAANIARKILLYLHADYEKKLTLKHLTEVFHINRTTLTEEFQRATNSSIIDYLIKLRVHTASIMIKNTDLPINEIMYRNGFNDNTHFGRMFKKHTGYSPSDYRTSFKV